MTTTKQSAVAHGDSSAHGDMKITKINRSVPCKSSNVTSCKTSFYITARFEIKLKGLELIIVAVKE